MGYAGYIKAKLPPPPPSAVQAALMAVPLESGSLDVIERLLRNVAVNPSEDKYRRVRLGNGKIKAALVDVPAALEALLALGWARETAGEEDSLVVPKGKFFSMAEVRQIDEIKERLRKQEKEAARNKAASKVPGSKTAAEIRSQMEADRRERAAKDPITQGSIAQKLPASGSSTCKDIGIGDDCQDC